MSAGSFIDRARADLQARGYVDARILRCVEVDTRLLATIGELYLATQDALKEWDGEAYTVLVERRDDAVATLQAFREELRRR